jgi:hypothetical protein
MWPPRPASQRTATAKTVHFAAIERQTSSQGVPTRL